MERLLMAAVLAAGLCLALPGTATAAAGCEHRTAAHIAEHGGRHTDDAWHIARGQLPSCDDTGSDHNADSEADGSGRATAPPNDSDKDTDDKSRFCRSRWYC